VAEQKMNPEIKARWVAALRSGEYQQGKGKLNQGGAMCCLGVLCDLHARETGGAWEHVTSGVAYYAGSPNYLPERVQTWADLPDRAGATVEIRGDRSWLPWHNDGASTFAEIADAIEAQL
jgi:hypothetical protein